MLREDGNCLYMPSFLLPSGPCTKMTDAKVWRTSGHCCFGNKTNISNLLTVASERRPGFLMARSACLGRGIMATGHQQMNSLPGGKSPLEWVEEEEEEEKEEVSPWFSWESWGEEISYFLNSLATLNMPDNWPQIDVIYLGEVVQWSISIWVQLCCPFHPDIVDSKCSCIHTYSEYIWREAIIAFSVVFKGIPYNLKS